MKKALGLSLRLIPLLAVGLLVVSCDTPKKKALRALSDHQIEPTGKALLEAVKSGDEANTKLLLQAGVHTGYRDERGCTPLHLAIERKDVATTFLLLDAGSDPNAADKEGTSVLGYALQAGETAIADRLLQAGAKADGRMPGGESVLPWAIREGRLAFVSRAVEVGAADPHLKDKDGNSLVHVAMQSGRHDMTTALLDRGADSASLNAAGESLLHRALERGWLDLVPRLVKAGADPNEADAKGRTPVEEAITRRDAGLLDLFLNAGGDPNHRNPKGETAIHQALKAKWPEALKPLAKAGADFNTADLKGKTPLQLAMDAKDCDLAEALVGYGAKPLEGGWSGWLSRSLAAGDVTVVRRLLRMGVPADRGDSAGRLPTEIATLQGNGSMVRVLIDAGAPIGDSLYLACTKGNRGLAGLLLTAGASPNPSRAPYLDTPLGAAIRAGDDALVATLLTRGAHPYLRTAEGQSPLHVAISLRRHQTVAMLLANGANPNAPFKTPVRESFLKHVKSGTMRWVLKSDRNVTPIMLAAASGEVRTTARLMAAGAKLDVSTSVVHFWPINFASNIGDVPMMRVLLGRDPHVEERVIIISLSEQKARIYNRAGEEIWNTKVSTGKAGHSTPTGEYAVTNKYIDWKSTLYHAQMPFFLRLSCGDFGMHQGVVPNYPASHGCIRVPAGNAQKLYSMVQTGDRVKIVP